jgi:hypothetical protein
MAQAERMYSAIDIDSASSAKEGLMRKQYECNICAKRFPLEQGARTHAYMVHLLCEESSERGSEGDFSESNKLSKYDKEEIICSVCCSSEESERKLFSNHEALFQHFRAKHNNSVNRQLCVEAVGDEFTDRSSVKADSFKCEACGNFFSSFIKLQNHLEEGISPPPIVSLLCSRCNYKFSSQRAIDQHKTSCKVDEDQIKNVKLSEDRAVKICSYFESCISSDVLSFILSAIADWNCDVGLSNIAEKWLNVFVSKDLLLHECQSNKTSAMVQLVQLMLSSTSSVAILETKNIFLTEILGWIIETAMQDDVMAYKDVLMDSLAILLEEMCSQNFLRADVKSTCGRLHFIAASLGNRSAQLWIQNKRNSKQYTSLRKDKASG